MSAMPSSKPGRSRTTPLTALRIVGELDAIVGTNGSYAVRLATSEHTDEGIAAALGGSEKAVTV